MTDLSAVLELPTMSKRNARRLRSRRRAVIMGPQPTYRVVYMRRTATGWCGHQHRSALAARRCRA